MEGLLVIDNLEELLDTSCWCFITSTDCLCTLGRGSCHSHHGLTPDFVLMLWRLNYSLNKKGNLCMKLRYVYATRNSSWLRHKDSLVPDYTFYSYDSKRQYVQLCVINDLSTWETTFGECDRYFSSYISHDDHLATHKITNKFHFCCLCLLHVIAFLKSFKLLKTFATGGIQGLCKECSYWYV